MKRYFRIVYPYVNAGWYLAILGWHLRYLFGKTDYHNSLFKLMGMRMQRLGPHDSPISSPSKDLAGNTSLSRSPIAFLRTRLLPLLASSLNLILPTSIFLLKFLEWWSSSSFPRHLKTSTTQSLDIPAPSLPNHKKQDSTCPICRSEIINPTAVLESGYVFCYKCIFSYIESHNCCPVTQIKTLSGTEGLRRIRI
jgi:peroxin-12